MTYQIRLTGGPYDGQTSEFDLDFVPDATGMKPVDKSDRGPVYVRSRSETVTEDGPYVFDYMPPSWWDRLRRRR